MPWVRFSASLDFRARSNVWIRYRAGSTYLVKQACAEQAIRHGKGEIVQRPLPKLKGATR